MNRQTIDLFAEKLKSVVHPQVTRWDRNMHEMLEGLDPKDVESATSGSELYLKGSDGMFLEIPKSSMSERCFLLPRLVRGDSTSANYVRACEELDQGLIQGSGFQDIYAKVSLCLSDGQVRDVYYFMGVARERRD